ncbi:MAG: gliding motility-associated C-terminal domain-containing protein [Flavobacteriia bacterium]|nr:gliding motility-associated C-terminal domain-containing protein [Flavobacteriia bacterium]
MKIKSFVLVLFCSSFVFTQIIDPFSIRYQTNLKGGLIFLSNTSVGCDCSANNEMPPNGSGDNNNYSMDFVDIDNDGSTYMSSSDQLALPNCSEIIWAGLYWNGLLNNLPDNTPNFINRNKVKISVNNGSYMEVTADNLFDNDIGKTAYFCFKDVTNIVQANPINSTFRIANVVTETGSNTFGAWTMVVVYQNIYESMKNITVFDGLANVSSGAGTVNIDLSGFLTPPSGAVNFELGVVAHDGDRAQTGDQLEFNGAGSFVNISDALHQSDNAFNSTISRNGSLTAFRNPSYNNNLGHDANIYSPDNSTFNFIGNAATSASIRVSTQSETVLTSVITSAIDGYEPDLRAGVSYVDINGGTVVPGDILEYTVSVKNIGSDVSTGTYLTDTLDNRLSFVPGSLEILYGPNSGVKTDVLDSDQAEYLSSGHLVKARIGTSANGTVGGNVINSSNGADSTVLKFRVQLLDDCPSWQCGTTLENKAYVFGTGQISGITNGNNGLSDQLDQNGCPSPESGIVTINVNSCPTLEINYTDSICVGETLQFSFPSSTFLTYQWVGPNSFSSTISNPEITDAQLIHSGEYQLLVTYNGQSCTDDTLAPVFVSENPSITLLESQNDSCYHYGGGFIRVQGNGNAPFTYQWSNNDLDSLAGSLFAGSYDVSVVDTYGCTYTESFSISEPPVFEANASITSNYNGQNISCFGENDGSATVSVNGGVSPIGYSWLNTGISTPDINSLTAGEYVVELTDDTGCKAWDTIVLTQPEAITITGTVTNVLCYGNSTGEIDVTISGGTLPYSFLWSNNELIEDLISIPAGVYTDTVTDINSCSVYQSFTVTQPDASMIITAQTGTLLCYGDNNSFIDLSINGGIEPYTFLWSGGEETEDLSNLSAGDYTVTVSDNNLCPQNFDVSISQPDSLTVIFNNINPVCQQGSQGSIEMQVTGGTPNYSYLWNNGETTEDINALYAGNYFCEVTDYNGCIDTIYTSLSDPDAIQMTEVITDVLCYGATTGSINITLLNGLSPYLFDWSNNTNNEDANNLSAGEYWVNVIDGNSCGGFKSFIITQPDTLIYITSSNNTTLQCFGDQDASIDIEVAGGTGTFDYQWDNGPTTQDINSLAAGTYSVTITDDNACELTESFTIDTPDALVLTETHTDVNCYGESTASIQVTSSGGTIPYDFLWSNNSISEDLTSIPEGNYQLTLTDANLCTQTISVTITQPDSALLLNTTVSDLMCFGDSIAWINLQVLGGTPTFTYLWSNGETTQNLTQLQAGSYSVTVTDANGCVKTTNVDVSQISSPVSLSANSTPTCEGKSEGSVSVSAIGSSPPYTYIWNNGSTDSSQIGLSIGTYSVNVTDQAGCQSNISVSVAQPENNEGCIAIEMPNVFTPDNDGKNDFFGPVKAFNIKEYHVTITNRWGNSIYEADGYSPGWDGKSNGKEIHDGVYFYIVDYVDVFGEGGRLQGYIHLVKEK